MWTVCTSDSPFTLPPRPEEVPVSEDTLRLDPQEERGEVQVGVEKRWDGT